MIFDIFRSKSSSSGEEGESSSSSEVMKPLGETGERKAFERYAQESNLPPSSEWPSESPLIVVPSIRAKEVKFDIYIRESNIEEARYVCSLSKLRSSNESQTLLVTRICSKFK